LLDDNNNFDRTLKSKSAMEIDLKRTFTPLKKRIDPLFKETRPAFMIEEDWSGLSLLQASFK